MEFIVKTKDEKKLALLKAFAQALNLDCRGTEENPDHQGGFSNWYQGLVHLDKQEENNS